MSDGEHSCAEHCGIFTIGGELPIQGAYRDICYQPVRDNIWTASEGIYRTIFLEGVQTGCIAFDTFGTPGTARAYQQAIGRVFPKKPVPHRGVLPRAPGPLRLRRRPGAGRKNHRPRLCQPGHCRSAKSSGQTGRSRNLWAKERTSYEIDGCYFELIYPGHTHGDGNIAAYLPPE